MGALTAAALLSGSALAGEPPFNADCSGTPCRIERVPVPWGVLGVSADARTLSIAYLASCTFGTRHVAVTEAPATITISVDRKQVVAVSGQEDVPCPAIFEVRRARVRLNDPVGGRRIQGGPSLASSVGSSPAFAVDFAFPTVPRVIDLAAVDARATLRAQGFKMRARGPSDARVVSQAPAGGRRDKGRTIRVRLGQHSSYPPPPKRILLASRGRAVAAPVGNDCGQTAAGYGCNQAFFPGHPTRTALPLRPGGSLDIRAPGSTRAITMRTLDRVARGGGPEGAVGPALRATRVSGHAGHWSVRLPKPLNPSGGVTVVLSFAGDCSTGAGSGFDSFGDCATYYADATTAR